MHGRSRWLVHAGVASCILIWGSTWAVIRVGLRGIPPFSGVAIRFVLAGVLMLGIARLLGVPWEGRERIRWIWLVQTVFSFSLSYGTVYWAEQWVSSGLAAILFSTFPLFVACLAHFVLDDERLTTRSLLGILVGFSGVAVIFSDDLEALGGRQVVIASLVLLASPLAGAIGSVAVKRWGTDFHPVNLNAVPMLATGIVMGALAALLEAGEPIRFDLVSTSALLYLAVFGSAISFTVYYWLLARLPATRLSLITYAIPVVAVLVGWIFLGEAVTAKTLGGAALVLVGLRVSG